MSEFTVKFGLHVDEDGEVYGPGDVCESDADLNQIFLNKFEPSVGKDRPSGPNPPIEVKPPVKKGDKDKKTQPVASRFKEKEEEKE